MVGIMAEDEYTSYNNHIGTADDGYDSEEEFIDDSQFEDAPDYIDPIEEDGTEYVIMMFMISTRPFFLI